MFFSPSRLPILRNACRMQPNQPAFMPSLAIGKSPLGFPSLRSHDFHFAVMIAVAVVGMVQVAVDQVVDVIAMRDRFMTTIRAMNVVRSVTGASMTACAIVWIRGIDRQ